VMIEVFFYIPAEILVIISKIYPTTYFQTFIVLSSTVTHKSDAILCENLTKHHKCDVVIVMCVSMFDLVITMVWLSLVP
jgi:hypothetical protein